jgi:hypothetical protein
MERTLMLAGDGAEELVDRNLFSSCGWGDLAGFSRGFPGVLSGAAAR